MKVQSNNKTSGIRGVSMDKQGKWRVDFRFKNNRLYFKSFDIIEEAVYLRYLCEITFQKELRHTSNDTLIFSHINKLSEKDKSEINNYFKTKINTLKDGV